MPVTFTLNITITGNSLGEIDDGVVQAAGERIKQRMVNPAGMNFAPPMGLPPVGMGQMAKAEVPPVPTVQRHEAQAPALTPAPTPMEMHRPIEKQEAAVEERSEKAEPETVTQPALPETQEGPKKRGRKPGVKVGSYKKKGDNDGASDTDEEDAEEEVTNAEGADALGGDSVDDDVQSSVPPARKAGDEQGNPGTTQTSQKVFTNEEAVEALKELNAAKDIDTARDLLASFNVKRCSELTDANRGAFIAKAKELAAS